MPGRRGIELLDGAGCCWGVVVGGVEGPRGYYLVR